MKSFFIHTLTSLLAGAILLGATACTTDHTSDETNASADFADGQTAADGEDISHADTDETLEGLAPDFPMMDANGNQVNLSDLVGKPIVLNFWASWCPPCKAEMPDFEEAYKKYGDDVVFVMLNLTDGYRETKAKADAHVASCGYTFPVYYDTAMKGAIAYKVSAVPQTCFINARGQLVSTSVGMMDGATLEGWIERLLRV